MISEVLKTVLRELGLTGLSRALTSLDGALVAIHDAIVRQTDLNGEKLLSVNARLHAIESRFFDRSAPAYVVISGTMEVNRQDFDAVMKIQNRMHHDTPSRRAALAKTWRKEVVPISWCRRVEQGVAQFQPDHPMTVNSVELYGGPYEITSLKNGNMSVETGFPTSFPRDHRWDLREPTQVAVGYRFSVGVSIVEDYPNDRR